MGQPETEAIREVATAEMTAILDHLPIGVCVIQRDGTIRIWNQRLEIWTGLKQEQLIGQKLSHCFPGFKLPRYQKRLQQVLEQGIATVFPSRLYPHLFPCQTATGKPLIQHTIVTPIPAANAGFEAMLSVQDVTDTYLAEQGLQTLHQQEQLLEQIVGQIRQSLDVRQILQTTVTEVRKFLQADRVLIYRINASHGRALILTEDCAPACIRMVNWQVRYTPTDAGLLPEQQTQVQAVTDITHSDLDLGYIQLLRSFGVQSRLSIPIWQSGRLWGLLIAHQCRNQREWQVWEINLLKRLSDHLTVAIQQGELYQQVQGLNVDLERKIVERTLQLQQALELEATLKRITDKVRDSLDEDQILQVVVDELGQGVAVEYCNTGLYHEAQPQATISHYYRRDSLSHLPDLADWIEIPELHTQLRQGSFCQFCPIMPEFNHPWEHSLTVLICPILDNQGVLGDIRLVRHRLKGFGETELRLVQQVANQCGIALRQSRLYREAQNQVQELEKLNQLKTDFLSTISHELRTPLSSIKLAVQVLEIMLRQLGILEPPQDQHSAQSRKIRQYLEIVQQECEREIALIADILTLQQLDAGTQPFIPSMIQLQYWIPQVLETFEEQLRTQHQALQLSIPSDLPGITTDLFMFNRLLGELLTNACRFTPAGGQIAIALELVSPPEVNQPWMTLKVSNTGVELPETELEAIFQLFYRVPSNNPWKYGGTGMGLALTRRLASNLGGRIWAESSGGQTCFTVQLPLQPGSPSR